MPKVKLGPATAVSRAVRQWDRRGSRGDGLQEEINRAPSDLSELAEYFGALPRMKLASCWVACTVDAAMLAGLSIPETGALARTLVVVAERLHGVTEPGVLPAGWSKEFIMPGTKDPAERYVERRTAQESERRTQDEQERLRRAEEDAERAGFSVGTGLPPPPARSSKSSAIYRQILALEPGQFIVVKKSKFKPSQVSAMLNNAKKETSSRLRRYAIANGDMVIIRDEDGSTAGSARRERA